MVVVYFFAIFNCHFNIKTLFCILFPGDDFWFGRDCDQNFTFAARDDASLGTISSPGYPDNYPMPGTVCKYRFFVADFPGSENMRIQISFVDFDLKSNDQSRLTCVNSDHIRINFPAAPQQPLKFCGKTRPYAVMSPSPSLELSFFSEPTSLGLQSNEIVQSRGYQFQYRFISQGFTEPKKNSATTQKSSKALESIGCEFNFYSWETSNGSFSSTNHPGFYPRNSQCSYNFVGRPNERVMLIFTFFDVRSVSQE